MDFGTVDIILTILLAVAVVYAMQLFNRDQPPSQKATKPAALTGSKTAAANTTAASAKQDGPVPTILFLFGSESGTAENFATDLAEEAPVYGFKSRVLALDDFSPLDFEQEQFVVFIVATHGEGEPCSNSQQFWEEWVTKEHGEREANQLSNITFAVFGCGNRQYRHFNAIAKRVDKEMEICQAERLLPLALGDDDGTMEEDMDKFKTEFWAASRVRFLAGAADIDVGAPSFNATYDVTIYPNQSEAAKGYVGGLERVQRFFNDPAKEHLTGVINVAEAKELRTATDDKRESTAHVEFSLEGTKLTYRTADNLGIHPRNDFKIAGTLAKRVGMDMKTVFAAKTQKGATANRRVPFPSPCSVEDCFLYFLDIQSIPKHKFTSIFATYAKDEKEKAKLLHFAQDAAGKEEFHKLRYNWLDLLCAFPSVDVPFSHLVEMIPRLQPRSYTIASSAKVQPKKVAITVTRYFGTKPHNQEDFKGVASEWLCNSINDSNNNKVVAFVKGSLFRLPYRAGTPIIMIGPGTGLAPFRGFVQEFRTRTGDHKFGETILFFGCRDPAKDYIYREELEQAKADGVLTDLFTAFSRVPGQPKTYVQQMVAEQGERLWKLIDKGAYIYVCGGTSMGRDVLTTFHNIVSKYGNYTAEQAETYVDKLIRQNRYAQELY